MKRDPCPLTACVLLAVTLLLAGGCEPLSLLERGDRLPPAARFGRTPSMLAGAAPVGPGSPVFAPWYADRRDALPTIAHGQRGATVETSVRYIHDDQSSTGGGVRDRYHWRSRGIEIRTFYR